MSKRRAAAADEELDVNDDEELDDNDDDELDDNDDDEFDDNEKEKKSKRNKRAKLVLMTTYSKEEKSNLDDYLETKYFHTKIKNSQFQQCTVCNSKTKKNDLHQMRTQYLICTICKTCQLR